MSERMQAWRSVDLDKTDIKRFTVYRRGDISETHTSDLVNPPDVPQYEGAVFSDGKCVLRWLTEFRSVSVWDSFADAMGVHGHFGPKYGTEIVWHDIITPGSDMFFVEKGIYTDIWGYWYADEADGLNGPCPTLDHAKEEQTRYLSGSAGLKRRHKYLSPFGEAMKEEQFPGRNYCTVCKVWFLPATRCNCWNMKPIPTIPPLPWTPPAMPYFGDPLYSPLTYPGNWCHPNTVTTTTYSTNRCIN